MFKRKYKKTNSSKLKRSEKLGSNQVMIRQTLPEVRERDSHYYRIKLMSLMEKKLDLGKVIKNNLKKEKQESIKDIASKILSESISVTRYLTLNQINSDKPMVCSLPNHLYHAIVFSLTDATHNMPRHYNEDINRGLINDISEFFIFVVALEVLLESIRQNDNVSINSTGLNTLINYKEQYRYLLEV